MVSSPAKAELLMLYHRNPGLIDTIDGVARRLGYGSWVVETEAKDLVEMGILRTKKVGALTVYSLDSKKDKEIMLSAADSVRELSAGDKK
jgi:predicted transcriptional regulator